MREPGEVEWVWRQADDDAARVLAQELGVHPLVARVLVARGHGTPELASAFLDRALESLPSPLLMKGLKAAVERLVVAVQQRQSVALWGDYDVDGVCSTALLASFLQKLGLAPRTYIPHRLAEGYGLNAAGIERLAAEGHRMLVTLDCGITSHAEVALGQKLGMDVIVVDHHAVPDTMPPALAVLNPLQPGCQYPTRWLCAGGVTFNLCLGLRRALREAGFFAGRAEPNLKQDLDLVALATVADVVPLTGANRILVSHGLEQLTAGRRPGIKALKEVAQVEGEVTATHVGFRLGPRINAAGRLQDASVGLQLLLSSSLDEARPLARALDEANGERQQLERALVTEATAQAEVAVEQGARGLVLSQAGWHPGVVGIVASRLVERFHRPTVVVGIHEGVGRGSARSIDGFHLHEALQSLGSHLTRFGGHKAAAGLSIEPEAIPAFRRAFEALARERLSEGMLRRKAVVDVAVGPQELTLEAVEALAVLAPFGMGNPEPTVGLRGQSAAGRLLANKSAGEAPHLKLALAEAPFLDVIGFRLGSEALAAASRFDLAGHASVDTFRGERRVSLKLRHLLGR